jgi:hypothetical protein
MRGKLGGRHSRERGDDANGGNVLRLSRMAPAVGYRLEGVALRPRGLKNIIYAIPGFARSHSATLRSCVSGTTEKQREGNCINGIDAGNSN